MTQSVGNHCVLELYGIDEPLLNDVEFIRNALREASEASGATLVDSISHGFTPYGVTALGLLSESHISIHTWPEFNYAAADIFTCGDRCIPQRACEHLVEAFGAESYNLRVLDRGFFEARTRHEPGEPLRAVNAGPLEMARIVEALTPMLIAINGRYKTHAGIRITGLPDGDHW